MFDDEELLRDRPPLHRLLEHYAQVSDDMPDAWQDRPAELDGVTGKELVQLHGELLAQDWIEQNTGVVLIRCPGVVAACYRVTPAGRRALRWAALGAATNADEAEWLSDHAA